MGEPAFHRANIARNLTLARRVASIVLLSVIKVHSRDIGNTLFSRHRLHPDGEIHLPAAQSHPRYYILNLVTYVPERFILGGMRLSVAHYPYL